MIFRFDAYQNKCSSLNSLSCTIIIAQLFAGYWLVLPVLRATGKPQFITFMVYSLFGGTSSSGPFQRLLKSLVSMPAPHWVAKPLPADSAFSVAPSVVVRWKYPEDFIIWISTVDLQLLLVYYCRNRPALTIRVMAGSVAGASAADIKELVCG